MPLLQTSTSASINEWSYKATPGFGGFVAADTASTRTAISNGYTPWGGGTGAFNTGALAGGPSGFIIAQQASRTIEYSTNGTNWTSAALALPAARTWGRMAYGNGRYIIVSTSVAQGAYATWATKTGWTNTTFTAVGMRDIVYVGNSVWVAVGNNSLINRSTDNGSTWSVVSSGTTGKSIARIVYAPDKNRLLASCVSSNTMLYSNDGGLTWSSYSGPISPIGLQIPILAYANGNFFMANQNTINNYSVSSTGTSWGFVGTLPNSLGAAGVATGNGLFLYTNPVGNQTTYISTDGTNWSAGPNLPATGTWSEIAFVA